MGIYRVYFGYIYNIILFLFLRNLFLLKGPAHAAQGRSHAQALSQRSTRKPARPPYRQRRTGSILSRQQLLGAKPHSARYSPTAIALQPANQPIQNASIAYIIYT